MNKNFSIMGVGGYIAPKHMQAIKTTGNNLLSALDPNDSVGIIDSYFRDALYFKEFERYDRHIFSLSKVEKNKIHYISICSPNYLHDSHIRFALRSGSNAICEKPLVLNLWNLEKLFDLERVTNKKVYTILQLRHHKSINKIKKNIDKVLQKKNVDIDLTYITSRGNWYFQSWKGNAEKSGGIATNIGIHFFDMLHYIFGATRKSKLFLHLENKQSGFLELDNANVRWFLSIDYNDLPKAIKLQNKTTYRSIKINGKEIEFSDGFEDLHTESYRKILSEKGFGIEENRNAIETVSNLRNSTLNRLTGDYHPLLKYIK